MYYYDEYEMTIAAVQAELEAYAKKEKRMRENTRPMGKWTTDAYGVAECRTSSFSAIFEAYQEYKNTCWSHTYDNY